jgi:hypothetical protein
MVAPLGCAGKEPTKMQLLAQAARPVIASTLLSERTHAKSARRRSAHARDDDDARPHQDSQAAAREIGEDR